MKRNSRRCRFAAMLWGCICIWAAAVALASCGQQGGGEETEPESSVGQSAASSTETEKLVVTYQTLPTSVLDDLEQVTAAVNEVTREEIGVEIVFRLADESDAFTQYPLWISKNERVDLMMLNGQDITTYVSRGMLKPLDSLLDSYGDAILSLLEEGVAMTEGAVVKGRAYGVAPVPDLPGNGYGLWTSARLVRETGLAYSAIISSRSAWRWRGSCSGTGR